MDTAELDAALIENLADLDAMAARLDVIEGRLWKALGHKIERWAQTRGWKGEFEARGEFWVCPPDWGASDDPKHRFYFGYGPHDDRLGLTYDLSRWCGAGGGQLCLWFGSKLGKSKWRPVARAAADRLDKAHFRLSDSGEPYIECTPALATVAAAFREGDLTVTAQPLLAALEHAFTAKPLFDRLLEQANT